METTLDLHPQPRIDVRLLALDEPGHWRQHPNQHHRRTSTTALRSLRGFCSL